MKYNYYVIYTFHKEVPRIFGLPPRKVLDIGWCEAESDELIISRKQIDGLAHKMSKETGHTNILIINWKLLSIPKTI